MLPLLDSLGGSVMKKATYSVVLFASVAAAYVAGSWSNQTATAKAEPLAARRVLYYVDPMHPTYKSLEPGRAPDCGMQLEPVYGDARAVQADASDAGLPPGTVTVSAAQQQLIGVRVTAVEQSSRARAVHLFGRVAAEETRVYKVNIGVDGYFRKVSAVTTGSRVQKDQWLATVSSPEARQPIQAYLVSLDVLDRSQKAAEAPAQIKLATAAVQQAIDRMRTLGMSPVQIDEINQTRVLPPNFTITAPAAGFVMARNASPGQKIEKNTELYQIADLSKVWIHADAFGVEGDLLRPGVQADVILPGRTRSVRARVTDVLPQFDPASQSLKIRLEADNQGYVLRPDMFVDVEVRIADVSAMTVPSDAVVDTGLGTIVFVERGGGLFEPRQVETGWRSGDRVEIVSGLREGERVAASGTFLLDSERRMRLAASETGAER